MAEEEEEEERESRGRGGSCLIHREPWMWGGRGCRCPWLQLGGIRDCREDCVVVVEGRGRSVFDRVGKIRRGRGEGGLHTRQVISPLAASRHISL